MTDDRKTAEIFDGARTRTSERPQPSCTSVWPRDYPPECDCNPPSHTAEEIAADESFHSRTCPARPTRPVVGS